MHMNLQSEYNWVALDEQAWQRMINRARSRSHREARATEEDEEQRRGPRPEDKLWEIGCQV